MQALPALLLSVLGAVLVHADSTPATLAADWNYEGIVVNEAGWDLWGASPVVDDDGKVHLFVARWPSDGGWEPGWRFHSEIARYLADSPEGPFTYQETVRRPDPDADRWDRLGLHNPQVQRLRDGRYVLSYIGRPSREGQPGNQRIGMLVADSPEGPWKPVNGGFERPLLDVPDDPGVWCHGSGNGVCNPALLEMPDGTFHLYFKASDGRRSVMGVAVAPRLEGPYAFRREPITGNRSSIEDGYAFRWNDEVVFITTDNHGILEDGGGLLWRSKDGLAFEPKPLPAFPRFDRAYLKDADRSGFRVRYTPKVKFERPQVLVDQGCPRFLYLPCGVATDGSDGSNVHLLRNRGWAPAGAKPAGD